MSEPCSCSGPGYCARWGVFATHHLWLLCRDDDALRERWSRGEGPFSGRLPPAPAAPRARKPLECVHLGAWEGKTVECLEPG